MSGVMCAIAGAHGGYPALVNGFGWVSGNSDYFISAANVRLSDLSSSNIVGGGVSGGSGSYSISIYLTVDSHFGDVTAIMFLSTDGSGTHTTVSVNNFNSVGTAINAQLHFDVSDTVTGLSNNRSFPINVLRSS